MAYEKQMREAIRSARTTEEVELIAQAWSALQDPLSSASALVDLDRQIMESVRNEDGPNSRTPYMPRITGEAELMAPTTDADQCMADLDAMIASQRSIEEIAAEQNRNDLAETIYAAVRSANREVGDESDEQRG